MDNSDGGSLEIHSVVHLNEVTNQEFLNYAPPEEAYTIDKEGNRAIKDDFYYDDILDTREGTQPVLPTIKAGGQKQNAYTNTFKKQLADAVQFFKMSNRRKSFVLHKKLPNGYF